MIIDSIRFGQLEIPDDKVITMKRPILGFEHLSRFCLIEREEMAPFFWLHSIEDSATAFIVMNPAILQKDYRIESGRNWMKEEIEIKIRNHKKTDITVRIKEPMYRCKNWTITAKTHDYEKLDARNIAFDVPVKADGETVVTYTVEYTW